MSMQQVQLILFTLLWTAVWVAPVPRLGPRAELVAGLVPFAAFGLRVFAGFFAGVPADDPVRSAVAPVVDWVNGTTGPIPYAVVLDATVALGLVWFAAAFHIPRRSRVATAWIMPAVAVASLASGTLAGEPFERFLADRLPPPFLAACAGWCIAAVIAWTPGEIPASLRNRAALVAVVVTPVAAAVGGMAAGIADRLPFERRAAAVSIAALATGAAAAAVAGIASRFTRARSRWLFALAVGVAAGAIVAAGRARP